MSWLSEAADRVRRDLQERPLPEGTLLLRARSLPPPASVLAALSRAPALVGEVRRAAPWAPTPAEVDPGALAAAYEAGGARAVSVWVEPRAFGGSPLDLRAVRRSSGLPVLCRDVLVHPSQILRARAERADAIVLHAAVLTASELAGFAEVARDLGMESLVEVHGDAGLDRAREAGAAAVVVSARPPDAASPDLDAALALVERAATDRVVVVTGGISRRAEVVRATGAGAGAVLVGQALLEAPDPAVTVRRLTGALATAGPIDP